MRHKMVGQVHLASIYSRPEQLFEGVAPYDVVCLDLEEKTSKPIDTDLGYDSNLPSSSYWQDWASSRHGELSQERYQGSLKHFTHVRHVVFLIDNALKISAKENQAFIPPSIAVLGTPSEISLEQTAAIIHIGAVFWPKPEDYDMQTSLEDKRRLLQDMLNAAAGIDLSVVQPPIDRLRGNTSPVEPVSLDGIKPRPLSPPKDFKPYEEESDKDPRQFYKHPQFGYAAPDLEKLMEQSRMPDWDWRKPD